MPKRSKEPEEALGPVLDGLDQLARLELSLRPAPLAEEMDELPEPAPDIPDDQVTLLLCGAGERAQKIGELGRKCGFEVEVVIPQPLPDNSEMEKIADAIYICDGYEDIAGVCGIGRNSFVCVFIEDIQECENVLCQVLHSDAAYIGVWAGREARKKLFAELKQDGVPDAELQAVCCPMGLGIGAITLEQEAVAVIAEIMAARNGALKRMRHI